MVRETFVVRDAVDVAMLLRAVRRRVWQGAGGGSVVEVANAVAEGREGGSGGEGSAAGGRGVEGGTEGEVVLVDERYVCFLTFLFV